MPDPEEIDQQQKLLGIHRRNLALYLEQQAKLGSAYIPPGLSNGIWEERDHIKHVKRVLRDWGVVVVDHPDDNSQSDDYDQTQLSPLPAPRSRGKQRNQVFISYSHADKKWVTLLQKHLKPLVRNENIKVWDDTMIAPGSNWREEIEKAVKSAKIAVLLVSVNYLASDFVVNEELPPLLAAAEKEGAVILPVIIGHCRFTQTKSLLRFQAVNDPAQPLAGLSGHRRDAVFVKLADTIEKSLVQVELSSQPLIVSNRVKVLDDTPKIRVDSDGGIWIGGKRRAITLPDNERHALKLLWDARGTTIKAIELAKIVYSSEDENAIYAVQMLIVRLQRYFETPGITQHRYIATTTSGYRLINYEDETVDD